MLFNYSSMEDNGTTELGYEIWRRKKIRIDLSVWQMATLTTADVNILPINLEPSVVINIKYEHVEKRQI